MRNVDYHRATPSTALEQVRAFLKASGRSYVQAVFEFSYFVLPEAVRARPVWFPDVARHSHQHYPSVDKKKGGIGAWNGLPVRVQRANQQAQTAWEQFTGTKLARRSGYGVRHIWGHPWDPCAFTAGWNLCYMPFWAGMVTEDQHPDLEVQRAICQASFDLFFRVQPVCEWPPFVVDPGLDLRCILGDQKILIMSAD
jgi:hypothetical protein